MRLTGKELEAAKKVYFAWDLPQLNEKAYKVLHATKGLLYNVKVNSAYTMDGPSIVKELKELGIEGVCMDMKFYDIPSTEANHSFAATMKNVDSFTVHASGGQKMMEYAKNKVKETAENIGIKPPKIFAVTVLTSFTPIEYLETIKGAIPQLKNVELSEYVGKSSEESEKLLSELKQEYNLGDFIKDQVLNLARLANNARINGLVCSSKEVKYVKKEYPALETLVPGIQNPVSGTAGKTQNLDRVATPSNAIRWGADNLVIGSAVHAEPDYAIAMRQIIDDIVKVI